MDNYFTEKLAAHSAGQQGRKRGHPRHKGAGSSREEIAARFWLKVNKSDGCWEWNAHKLKEGYGMFGIHVDGNWTFKPSHRVAYELEKGQIPKGMFVCHKCDNPSCVNPEHLFLGTHKDNMQDRKAKGRYRGCGGSNGKRLSDKEVAEIRSTKVVWGTISELARKFGMSRISIRRVIAGLSYQGVAA